MYIDLNALRNDAIFDIQSTIQYINTSLSWPEFQSNVKRLCNQFLIAAAASFYVDLKPQVGLLNFCRSAENWRRLNKAAQKHYGKSVSLQYNAPIMAGLVTADKNLINALIQDILTQKKVTPNDNKLVHSIGLLLLLSRDDLVMTESIAYHLGQLEQHDPGGSRVGLTKSLLHVDEMNESDFWIFFSELIEDYEIYVEKAVNNLTTSVTAFAANRYLNLEALAWLRLAQFAGYSVTNNPYRFCPIEALSVMQEQYHNDWVILSNESL